MSSSFTEAGATSIEDSLSTGQSGSTPLLTARRWRTLILALLLAGTVFRVAQYLSHRSFWEDEAFIVLNLRHKPASELLFGRLDYSQAAPPLFLLAGRAAVLMWGGSEFSLRLMPLAAGIASLGLMVVAARRVSVALPDVGSAQVVVLTAVALLATSDHMIQRTVEVKPYAGDALAAIILTVLALAGPRASSATARLAAVCTAATFLLWFSYAVVFVFAGLSLMLLPAVMVDRTGARISWRGIPAYVGLNLVVVASFLTMFLAFASRQQSSALRDYWAEDFGDLTNLVSFAGWASKRFFTLCHTAAEPLGPVILGFFVVGVIVLIRTRRWDLLAGLTLPIVITMGAACAKRYPFDGQRMTTFLIPSVLLITSIGFAGVIARFQSKDDRRKKAAVFVLAAVPLAMCIYHLAYPRTRAHVRPAVAYVASRYVPGDEIFCNPNPAQFLCYWPTPNLAGVDVEPPPESLERLKEEKVAPIGRFWVVFAYAPGHEDRLKDLLTPAKQAGDLREQFIGYGGAAFLFEARTLSIPATARP